MSLRRNIINKDCSSLVSSIRDHTVYQNQRVAFFQKCFFLTSKEHDEISEVTPNIR